MRILLVYPQFPKSFWSFEKTLDLVGFKAQLPPLGMVTVAAILPQTWEFKLVDRNIRAVTEAEWEWAEGVILSAMIVQRADFAAQIQTAKQRGKWVAVGGPYPTAIPQEAEAAGADFLILDEGEITLPLFVEAVERGDRSGVFRSNGERPAVTDTPIPRFDLLQLDAYAEMSVQFSRGCPFQCEFCDIIVLYGRKPRTKTPAQLLAELQRLYDLGWRRSIFVVDDNFIGNKRNVKLLLQELKPWLETHDYPFSFGTEASVDLAQDPELMEMMVDCRFGSVFLGVETPDTDSLALTKKFQNNRDPLSESVLMISRAGLRIMAGFIIGFDNEKPGAGERVVQFVEETAIPTAFFSMLQALPDTGLWHRLTKEGRLLTGNSDINQSSLMNFVPTRPLEQITQEYIHAFWSLYEPLAFLNRTYRHFLILGEARRHHKRHPKTQPQPNAVIAQAPLTLRGWVMLRALGVVCWRQGIKRNTRWQFWHHLFSLLHRYPNVVTSYLSVCAQGEHFIDFRHTVRDQIEAQLAEFLLTQSPHAVNASNPRGERELAESA
jgi:radical SAM superfamily enzyme YgiQ (UPF0313 family)